MGHSCVPLPFTRRVASAYVFSGNETLTEQDRDNIHAFHLKIISRSSKLGLEELTMESSKENCVALAVANRCLARENGGSRQESSDLRRPLMHQRFKLSSKSVDVGILGTRLFWSAAPLYT
jgi:hypothetical protein